MRKINDGGAAFPQSIDASGPFGGMTLRDYFAGQALAAMVARGEDDGAYAADSAYRYADAMLKAHWPELKHIAESSASETGEIGETPDPVTTEQDERED